MPIDEGESRQKASQEQGAQGSVPDAPIGNTGPALDESQPAGAESNPLQETQQRLMARAAGLQRAAEAEAKRRQEEADMADFKRQIRESDAAKKGARTYTVQPGDSLSAIALSLYGDASCWPEIFKANGDKISNPNLIYPGQELTIP